MKAKSLLVFFVFCINSSFEWTAIEITDNGTSHPGYCYSKTNGVGAMQMGEVKQKSGECVKIECTQGGLIIYSGCGTLGTPRHCKPNLGDPTKEYPKCCPQITCD